MHTWMVGTDGGWVIAIGRIVLGVVFFRSRSPKSTGMVWWGRNAKHCASIPRAVGSSRTVAALAVAAEFLGGLGLIVGLLSCVAALGIAVVMLVALVTVHRKFGFFMNWFGEKKGHGIEYHVLVPALALIVIFKGAGAFSLDQVLYQNVSAQNRAAMEAGTGRGQ